jgi:uncharacterized protein (UPF0548 family)
MTEWRIFRGWTSDELRARLDRLATVATNFEGAEEELTGERGWHHWQSEAIIAREEDGSDARFARARVALANYQFSDPKIVVAHFDPRSALLGRRIMLEIKVFGLRCLCAAVVTQVREEVDVFGFRYDTLDWHIERGMEWFLLTRDEHGNIRFRIEARRQRGVLPHWWMRAGFAVLAGYYQRKWHRRAHRLLSLCAHHGSTEGIDVAFTYHTKRKWLT